MLNTRRTEVELQNEVFIVSQTDNESSQAAGNDFFVSLEGTSKKDFCNRV